MTDQTPTRAPQASTRLVNALCGLYRARRGEAVSDCDIATQIMGVSPSTLSNWTSGRHPANQLEAVLCLMLELPAEDVAAAIHALYPQG